MALVKRNQLPVGTFTGDKKATIQDPYVGPFPSKVLDNHTVGVDWQGKANIGKRVNVQDIRVFIKKTNPAIAAGITQKVKASMALQIRGGSVMSNDKRLALMRSVTTNPVRNHLPVRAELRDLTYDFVQH